MSWRGFLAGCLVGVAAVVLVLLLAPVGRVIEWRDRLTIRTNTVYQDRLVPVPTGTDAAALRAEVDAWRTNDFRLWCDSSRIYASLYRRTAHAAYSVHQARHTVTVQAGADYAAIGYGYRLLDAWSLGGGLAVMQGQARPFLLISFSW